MKLVHQVKDLDDPADHAGAAEPPDDGGEDVISRRGAN